MQILKSTFYFSDSFEPNEIKTKKIGARILYPHNLMQNNGILELSARKNKEFTILHSGNILGTLTGLTAVAGVCPLVSTYALVIVPLLHTKGSVLTGIW